MGGQRKVPGESGTGDEAREREVTLGVRLKKARERRSLSVRALARELGVSASFVSQLENGKARPSVATLYSMSGTLDVSLDDLFRDEPSTRGGDRPESTPTEPPAGDPTGSTPPATHALDLQDGAAAAAVVVRPGDRRRLVLTSGVTWQQLSTMPGLDVDFMLVCYDVGGSSTSDQRSIRHAGFEFGFVTSGRLEVVLGFTAHHLKPGDSIAFDSTVPHRLTNIGVEPVEAIWVVTGRSDAAAP